MPILTFRKFFGAFGILLVAAAMSRLLPIVRDQLAAPFDLISEGPSMSLIEAVRDGFNIYAPESYTGLPFQIVPYVPLFHAVVAMLPSDPGNPFFTGRVLSMLFMLIAAASVFAISRPRDWLGAPLIAMALFFLIRPVTGNTAYLRSDSAGLFFSVAAVVILARPPSMRTAVLAGLSCALALACKQSFLAATVTCGLYLLMRSPRLALGFVAAELALGGLLAATATLVWGNGFWDCVLLAATHYPRDWPSFVVHWQDMLKQPIFTWILLMVALTSLAAIVRSPTAPFRATPYLLYVLGSFATQSSVLSGIGASNHYFFEPILASLLWLVSTSDGAKDRPLRDWIMVATLAVLAACVVAEFRYSVPNEYRYTTAAETEARVRNRDWVISEMSRLGIAPGPVLNLKNSTVTFDYPGEVSVNDPYLFFVMWEVGRLSTAPLLQAIRDRYFDAVIVSPGLTSGAGQQEDHPIQNILRVLFEHYQLTVHGEDVNVLTPQRARQGSPS